MAKSNKRKTFVIDGDVAYAMETFARDCSKSPDELAETAFRDFLKKHGRPISVEEALRQSVRVIPANDRTPPDKPKKTKRSRG